MRNDIPYSSFRRLLLAAFFVFLLMKQGALPVLAQTPSPTPVATVSAEEQAANKGQEDIEPVDISLKDLEFLPTLLTHPPLLFTFSLTLAMFLTALLIGAMPLSLWTRLIGLAPPRLEEAPLPDTDAFPSASGVHEGVVVQQTAGGPPPPAVIERQPGAPQQQAPTAQQPGTPPQAQPGQPTPTTQGQQQGQSSPQAGSQTGPQQAQPQQAQQGTMQQGTPQPGQQQGQPGAPPDQAGQQGQAQSSAQGQAQSGPQAQQQQQGGQPQQGGQTGTPPATQVEQSGLQDLLGNQEEEEDSLAGIDEDIQNILSGVFGEEEGIDPHLEFLATLLEDVDINELQKTLQQVAKILQRRKRQ